MMRQMIPLISCWLAFAGASAVGQSGTPAAADVSAIQEPDASPAPAQTVSVSQVRIVRLSQVAGQVQMDRKIDRGFESAFANLPIVAGAGLRTKEGIAEVEFEDNSSLRLTPESQVSFPRLGREASGATTTAVDLDRGSLYVSLASGKTAGEFTVEAGNQQIVLSPGSHLRVDFDSPTARMVVFQGSATVTGPSGSMVVAKKKAISFDTASAAAPEFIHIGDASAYDNWDKNAVDYHKIRSVAGFAGSPYAYGTSDLSYYGSFSDVGGCGSLWRPHLASAAWDPYSSGVWSYYSGQGYSWVSLYPWGWTPYHSGAWSYCGGSWGWSPQGNWNGLLNHPASMTLRGPGRGPVGGPVRPKPPTHEPLRGQPTTIAVNMASLRPSEQNADGKFVFRADSAGLGVPRGVFHDLGKISQHAETHGSATRYVSEHQASTGLVASSRSAGASSTARAGNSGSAASASHSSSASHSVSVVSAAPSMSSSSAGSSHSAGGSSGSHH